MTKVKICGVTKPAHALAAAEAGADFIGMVFAPSRRRLSRDDAKGIAKAVRGSGRPMPKLVGVFVNAEPTEVNGIAAEVGLDMAQLGGDEDDDYFKEIELPIIKTLHVPSGPPAKVAQLGLHRSLSALRDGPAVPLLDTEVEGLAGGTGRSFDWDVARNLAQDFDFLLAGGLTPENVAQAVAHVQPWAVDVSSGVETEGVKDLAKIQAFIKARRRADG